MAKKKKKTTTKKTNKKKSNKVVQLTTVELLDKLDKCYDHPVVVSVPGYKHSPVTDVFIDGDQIVLTTFPKSKDNDLLNAARALRKDFYDNYRDTVIEDFSSLLAKLFIAVENHDGPDPK